jgi:hypothetical protein
VWYVPKLTTLSADGDTVDGISGWTEYIIVDACIKALAKQESDVTVFALQKAELIKRIENAAENRDAGNPATVGELSFLIYGGQQALAVVTAQEHFNEKL